MWTAISEILLSSALAAAQPDASPASSLEAGRAPESATSSAKAADPDLAIGDPGKSESDFQLTFTPFFWLTSFSGSIEAHGIQVDLDKSVIDILNGSDLVFGLMGALELEHNDFFVQLNASWGTVEGSEEKGAFHNGSVKADVDVDGAFTELLAGYRFIDTPVGDAPESHRRFKLDAYAGGRATAINVDMTLNASTSVTLPGGEVLTAGQSKNTSQSGDWIEPFVGLRGSLDLDDHWLLQLRADVGGFGIDGSEFSWQTVAIIGYGWRLEGWNIAVVGGYRALGQDYSSGDFNWDVVTHGPVLGFSMSWAF